MVAFSRLLWRGLRFLAAGLVLACSLEADGQVPRVLPADARPDDARLGKPLDLNGYFPFDPPETVEAWQARSARLRRQLLVAVGLWPMPTKTPDNAVVHGRVERGDYTVERVYLESFPGHFVTGSLYRPKGKAGRHPAVLSPHGHWANGRFYDEGAQQVRQRIVEGAERFEEGGRSPLQARCVQLCRMGCVVFHYDMVGYGDSTQLEHRPGFRSAMNTPSGWGYFSPQAESRLQHMAGLQTYNSIRALDWLASLDDVDPARIAVTGASGGGTQTFLLAAVDERPRVVFPAVMVSTGMQGGCTCENCSYLRIGTGNVELAALAAPKPLGMTAAADWTREIAAKGQPELERLYRLLGASENLLVKPLLQFGHNYNYVSRAVMYGWLNRHLGLGLEEPIVEEDYHRLSPAELSVWNDKHPRPAAGDDYERSLLEWIDQDNRRQFEALVPGDAESLAEYRRVVGGAIDVLVGRSALAADAVEIQRLGKEDRGQWLLMTGLVRNKPEREELPALFCHPKEWNGRVVVWAWPQGKAGLVDSSGAPTAEVAALLAGGTAVVGADLFFQGEFLTADELAAEQPPRAPVQKAIAGYAGYAFGYNYTLEAQRARDLITLVSAIAAHPEYRVTRIDLAGFGAAAAWAAAAAAQLGDRLGRVALDTQGWRYATVDRLDDPRFLPGGAKYGDLPGIVALIAPQKLWLAGEGPEAPRAVAAAYQAAQAGDALRLETADEAGRAQAAAAWLLEE